MQTLKSGWLAVKNHASWVLHLQVAVAVAVVLLCQMEPINLTMQ
jgi:hypothetical protein